MAPSQAAAVNLLNLGKGAASELFEHEMKKVLANIKDQNTDPKKKRTITIKIDCVPFSDRSGFQAVVDVRSQLAAVPPVPAGNIFIMSDGNDLKAFSHDIRQEDLFAEEQKQEPAPASNVVSMAANA